MDFKDVLKFDKMLTPQLIIVIYYLLLLFVVVGGLGVIFSGEIFAGIGILILGAIGVRVWCEMFIVLFQLNKNVKDIADSKKETE